MQFFGVSMLAGMLCISFTFGDTIYRIESHKKGEEKVLIVKEKNTGKRVTEIDVFENDEYQVGKPEDEDYCLVSRILTREIDSPTCFKRINAAIEMQEDLPIDLTECGDRDIVYLEPTKCPKNDMGMNREPKNGLREKRANCYYKEELVSYCKRYDRVRKCVRYGWWFGRNSCKRYSYSNTCAEEGYRTVTTYHCP